MAPEVSILISAKDTASKAFKTVQGTGLQVGKALVANWGKIAVGAGVAAAGIEKLGRQAAAQNEILNKLAATTGLQTDALRELALETSNVTRPLEDVLSLFQVAQQQGARTGEELEKFAAFWDTVGDASGESAVQLGKAGIALRSVGIEAGNEQEALGALGFILKDTSLKQGEFLQFLEKTGPELRELNFGVNESAAVMGLLQDKFGATGREARTQFVEAVNESDGTTQGFLKTIGLTQQELDVYIEKVKGSSGVVQELADIHEESFTIMQKVQFEISKLVLEHGELLQAATALTPILIGVSTAITLIATVGPTAVAALRFLQAQLASLQAQTTLMAASMRLLGKTMSLVAAFAAGWQIGTILTERFAVVRQAGVALVTGLLVTWEILKAGAESVWIIISTIFEKGLNFIKEKAATVFSELAQTIQKAFEVTGLDILETQADKLFDIYDKIDDSITDTTNIQDALTEGLEDNIARLDQIKEDAAALFEQAGEPIANATQAVNEFTEANATMASNVAVDWENIENVITGSFDEFGQLIQDAQDEFQQGGMNTGTSFAAGLQSAEPEIAEAMNTNLQSIADSAGAFDAAALGANIGSQFAAGLEETEVTLPTQRFNAAIAGIVRAAGPTVGGGALQSAQAISAIQASQRASLPGFADGGIATRPIAGVFGEAGPEALIPLKGNNQLGTTNINNITIQVGALLGNDNDARIFAQRINDFLIEENARR